MNEEKPNPEIRITEVGVARRAFLVRSFYETTSFDEEMTKSEYMRRTAGDSDDDD